jgi:hypothetical protein
MGYPSYEAPRRLEAIPFEPLNLDPAFTTFFEAGRNYGYALAVEESYPELQTSCSQHGVFNSACEACVTP